MESQGNAEHLSRQVDDGHSSGEVLNNFNIAESTTTSANSTEIPEIFCVSSNASENLNVTEVDMI